MPNIFDFLNLDPLSGAILSGAVFIAAAFIAGRVLKIALGAVQHRLARRTSSSLDDFLLTVLKRCMTGLLVLGVVYWVSSALVAQSVKEPANLRGLLDVIAGAAYVLLLLYSALSVARLVDAFILWYLKDVAHRTNTHLDDELAPLVNRVMNVLVFVVAAIVILDHFGQNISTLVVSLGVGSLAIALAAQETLANTIAGFVLMIDRPFRPGDRVRLPDNSFANVREIGIRSTKFIDDDNVMVIVPNAEIVKSEIMNLSYPNDIVRFHIPFSVAYGTDLAHVQKLVFDVINKEPDIVEKDRTEVRVLELGESSVHMTAMAWIRNPNLIPPRTGQILHLIYDTLRVNGIEIPFPQRVVHLRDASQLAPPSALGE